MDLTSRAISFAAAAALSVSVAPPGPAQEREPRQVTLGEALVLFGRNNLDLRVARAEAAEAEGWSRQAGAYPNPTVSSTHERLSAGGGSYSESYVNLSQRLEWPGTRTARRDQAARSAAAARAALSADSARLAFQVKAAYVDAVRAESVLRFAGGVAEVFRVSERRAAERLDQGDISPYENRRIEVERTRYENLLGDAELDAAAARRRLALLVAPASEDLELAPADEALGLPPPVEAQNLLAAALGRRWEIAGAQAGLGAAEAGASLARSERKPDVTATGGYKAQSDALSGVFLGLAIPVPLWDRRGGAASAADARIAAAAARLDLVRRQVENDVLRALSEYRSLVRRAERMRDPGVDLLDVARAAYAEGEMELLELLDAAEALHQARLAEARLRADLWTSYYDLERAVGGYDAPGPEPEDGR